MLLRVLVRYDAKIDEKQTSLHVSLESHHAEDVIQLLGHLVTSRRFQKGCSSTQHFRTRQLGNLPLVTKTIEGNMQGGLFSVILPSYLASILNFPVWIN